jgi:ABC-type transport system involved in multi-copper enzyme maturation permease subunit
MTTAISLVRSVPTEPADGRPTPIPFSRLVKTELRKLVDTRAGRWLVIATLVLTPVVMAVMVAAAPTKDLTYNKFVDFTQAPQKYLLPVLGILTMTSEWSQRTGLVTFTLEPRRGRVLKAKFVAATALGLSATAMVFVFAAIGNVLGRLVRDGDGSWSFGAAGFGEITLVLLIGLVQGLVFGMALLASAAAIVTYFVVPTLWSALFSSASMKQTAPWFDLNQAGGALYNQNITGKGWLQLMVALAIWIGVPLAIGVLRVRRAEIK